MLKLIILLLKGLNRGNLSSKFLWILDRVRVLGRFRVVLLMNWWVGRTFWIRIWSRLGAWGRFRMKRREKVKNWLKILIKKARFCRKIQCRIILKAKVS